MPLRIWALCPRASADRAFGGRRRLAKRWGSGAFCTRSGSGDRALPLRPLAWDPPLRLGMEARRVVAMSLLRLRGNVIVAPPRGRMTRRGPRPRCSHVQDTGVRKPRVAGDWLLAARAREP